jgi:hypothetical protein
MIEKLFRPTSRYKCDGLTFLPGGVTTQYKCEAFVPGGLEETPTRLCGCEGHLYRAVTPTGTNAPIYTGENTRYK